MRPGWKAVVVLFVLFVFLVPVVPWSSKSPSNCVFGCPADLGVDYVTVSYALFGLGVYRTTYGTFGLGFWGIPVA